MVGTSLWPELHENHGAVELIDELFEKHPLERTGTVTSRYNDKHHTYHHYRVVVPFAGLTDMNEGEIVYKDSGKTVTFEEHLENQMVFLVDTGSIGS